MKNNEYSLSLLCDFYELTMGRGYFNTPLKDDIAYFDVFYRRVPDGGGYAVAAGLEQIVRYIGSPFLSRRHRFPAEQEYL